MLMRWKNRSIAIGVVFIAGAAILGGCEPDSSCAATATCPITKSDTDGDASRGDSSGDHVSDTDAGLQAPNDALIDRPTFEAAAADGSDGVRKTLA
jgi:hypothetical protein